MAPNPGSASMRCVAFRYSSYDTPFWARENSRAGRWHRPGDGPTQYVALSPAGTWAELIRNERLTSEDEAAQVHMQIWAVQIEEGHLADYRDFGGAESAGFDPDALVDDDYSRCQDEGRRLREQGFGGVLAPSAALPHVLNVTLFGPRYSIRWEARRILASAVPAAVVAIGAPPAGLVAQVRQRGQEHEALRQYHVVKAGRKRQKRSKGRRS